MLSKNQIKRIQSLARKKGRREEGCFIAEGNKLVEDTLSVFECDLILATPSWIVSHAHKSLPKIQEVDEQEMSKVSQLVTPPDVLAVYRIPEYHLNIETLKKELVLALDTVQDPGNLGTIVRLADWFGIRHIVCSPDTADLYNPKVVQATMGALARVKVYYRSLPDFLSQVDSSVVYGTFLDGEDIYHTSLTKSGVIVMGNEGNGISAKLEPYIGKRLYIPNYPVGQPTSESLNVAVALRFPPPIHIISSVLLEQVRFVKSTSIYRYRAHRLSAPMIPAQDHHPILGSIRRFPNRFATLP